MSTFNPIFYYNTITADPLLRNQIAYYPFDSNANDLINAYNGTSANIVYTNPGIVNTSATFNGTSSTINIPNPASNDFSFDTGAYSTNIWMYIPPAGVGGTILSKRDTVNHEWTMFHNRGLNQLIWTIRSTSGGFIGRTASIVIPSNTWSMITVTSSGGVSVGGIKIYFNGVLTTASNQGSGTYTGNNPTGCRTILGRQGNNLGVYLNARLDKARIWKGRELTQSEITNMYNTLY